MRPDPVRELARTLADAYAEIPEVLGVALGGSRATGMADRGSDLDLYVYSRGEVPLGSRAAVARARAEKPELDHRAFEPGDEWVEREALVHVDVMFRETAFIEGELDRVLLRHEARVGYSTCLWHNVKTCLPLYDRSGWLAALVSRAAAPYPDGLRRAIVAKNLPLLRRSLSSFHQQLERARERGDAVAVNHRIAAFLASAFDVVFALNRVLHPGEKRLLEAVLRDCPIRPFGFEEDVSDLAGGGPQAVSAAESIAVDLEAVAEAQGLAG
jgi:predicted nucleotidyltransferase